MSYITLRGRWCDVIVLNVHAPTEEYICEELEREFYQFSKYRLKILLEYFNEKVRREDIFKQIITNRSSYKIRNDTEE
jgi:hypothetical protein